MYTYEELKDFVCRCTRCSLSHTRHQTVMGRGELSSRILLIAEAPGETEDQTGVPFTGKSGQILDQILSAAKMSREEVYLTNIVKCRPPGNRDPLLQEQEACIPYLKYETLLVRPEMIICLGRVAAQRIIRPDFRITREHGTFLKRKNVWLTAIYHPSAVLRDPSKFDETVMDLMAAKKKLSS